jgi:hypothetical protein
MHCLMLLSSRRWVCVLSGSVHGRISELMHSKGATLCAVHLKVRQMTHQAVSMNVSWAALVVSALIAIWGFTPLEQKSGPKLLHKSSTYFLSPVSS